MNAEPLPERSDASQQQKDQRKTCDGKPATDEQIGTYGDVDFRINSGVMGRFATTRLPAFGTHDIYVWRIQRAMEHLEAMFS